MLYKPYGRTGKNVSAISFGGMRFDKLEETPQVIFECVTIDGDVIHRHTLPASELRF